LIDRIWIAVIRVKLHCIPPAIRMRSRLPVQQRSCIQQPANSTFQPRIVHPDLEFQRQQNMYRQAIQDLMKQLSDLIEDATDPGEILFHQQTINRLKGK
jgi:hypothetical protein